MVGREDFDEDEDLVEEYFVLLDLNLWKEEVKKGW